MNAIPSSALSQIFIGSCFAPPRTQLPPAPAPPGSTPTCSAVQDFPTNLKRRNEAQQSRSQTLRQRPDEKPAIRATPPAGRKDSIQPRPAQTSFPIHAVKIPTSGFPHPATPYEVGATYLRSAEMAARGNSVMNCALRAVAQSPQTQHPF